MPNGFRAQLFCHRLNAPPPRPGRHPRLASSHPGLASTRPGLVPCAQNGAGAGFPTPAPPDKRVPRHSMQDTQPSTAVPSRAI